VCGASLSNWVIYRPVGIAKTRLSSLLTCLEKESRVVVNDCPKEFAQDYESRVERND
jgi:hypothetical protein